MIQKRRFIGYLKPLRIIKKIGYLRRIKKDGDKSENKDIYR
jgi:hypothetical protein